MLELQRKTKKTKKFRELFVSIDFRRLKTPEIQRRRVAVHVCEPYNASRLPTGRAAFLYVENHSLGEWFQRRLVPMMKTEKLLLL